MLTTSTLFTEEQNLFEAIRNADTSQIFLLLTSGVPANCIDAEGNTPAMVAVKHLNAKTIDILRMLKSLGANLNVKNVAGQSLIAQANIEDAEYGQALFSYLVQKGVDSSSVIEDPQVFLRVAIKWQNLELITSLISYVNINAQDERGQTILMYAARKSLACVEAILAAKPGDLKDKQGKTALFYAADEAVMLRLLQAGADYYVWAKDEESIFHIIVKKQYVNVLRYLKTQMPLRKEILNAKQDGRTPIFRVAEILRQYDKDSELARIYESIFTLLYELGASVLIDCEQQDLESLLPAYMQKYLSFLRLSRDNRQLEQIKLISVLSKYGIGGLNVESVERGVCEGLTALHLATVEIKKNHLWEDLNTKIILSQQASSAIIHSANDKSFTTAEVVTKVRNLIFRNQFPYSKKAKKLYAAADFEIFDLPLQLNHSSSDLIVTICYSKQQIEEIIKYISLFPDNTKIKVSFFFHSTSLRYTLGNYYFKDCNFPTGEEGYSLEKLSALLISLLPIYKGELVRFDVFFNSVINKRQRVGFEKLCNRVLQESINKGISVEFVRMTYDFPKWQEKIIHLVSDKRLLELFMQERKAVMLWAMFEVPERFKKLIAGLQLDDEYAPKVKAIANIFKTPLKANHPIYHDILMKQPNLLPDIFVLLPFNQELQNHLRNAFFYKNKLGTFIKKLIKITPQSLLPLMNAINITPSLIVSFKDALVASNCWYAENLKQADLFLLFTSPTVSMYVEPLCRMLDDKEMQGVFIDFLQKMGLDFLNLILSNNRVKDHFNKAMERNPLLLCVVNRLNAREASVSPSTDQPSSRKRKAIRLHFFDGYQEPTNTTSQPQSQIKINNYFSRT